MTKTGRTEYKGSSQNEGVGNQLMTALIITKKTVPPAMPLVMGLLRPAPALEGRCTACVPGVVTKRKTKTMKK